MSPEVQAQTTTTTAPGRTGPGGRPWLEPAVLVASMGMGLAVTILALLLSIAFGSCGMNARVDALGARIDVLEINLNARIDAFGADLNAPIEQVYQFLLPKER
ncbi:MAG: hypothetical protein TE42_07495 [Candidatus Synechococcus spongiarum SP3]|uniref:Uncharacterized protein n=1 Tax=Candidatus Synechococcus spongiarum SP3 TaxID=1604020 RepID=A0A0G2HK29_9SYNE|nr:MAG: hypothetical protein TE42_07495 [Candidatus Synechococcus spongiarum SP3]